MNRRLLGVFAALITGLILAVCTFSLEPVNSLDTEGIANGNTGLINILNGSHDPDVSLSAVRIIQPDETFTEYRYVIPLTPDGSSPDYRFTAGVNYRVKFHNGDGWTTDATLPILLVKGQTVVFTFTGEEPITIRRCRGKGHVNRLQQDTHGLRRVFHRRDPGIQRGGRPGNRHLPLRGRNRTRR